jgi:hypothetical protein
VGLCLLQGRIRRPAHGRRARPQIGWDEAAGVYIGAGYCAQLYYWDNNFEDYVRYINAGDLRGPIRAMFVDRDRSWNRVVPYRC